MARLFRVTSVGVVQKTGAGAFIRVYKKYRKALAGLEQFSHIHVLYWFHENDTPQKRSVLQVHPCNLKANPLTGVFATHSPLRPNLIALTRCRILGIQDTVIRVDAIDARHGSPVLDIKCYFPPEDAHEKIRFPRWEKKRR